MPWNGDDWVDVGDDADPADGNYDYYRSARLSDEEPKPRLKDLSKKKLRRKVREMVSALSDAQVALGKARRAIGVYQQQVEIAHLHEETMTKLERDIFLRSGWRAVDMQMDVTSGGPVETTSMGSLFATYVDGGPPKARVTLHLVQMPQEPRED